MKYAFKDEMDMAFSRAILGGEHCEDHDFSTKHWMERFNAGNPMEILWTHIDSRFKGVKDNNGNFIRYYDDIPLKEQEDIDKEMEEFNCGNHGYFTQMAWDAVDLKYYNPHILDPAFLLNGAYTQLTIDPRWYKRKYEGPILECENLHEVYEPIHYNDRDCVNYNDFYDGEKFIKCKPLPEKEVVSLHNCEIKVKKDWENRKHIRETEYYVRRATLKKNMQKANMIREIDQEVIALQIEKERTEAQINTMDILTEPMNIYNLRCHLNDVQTEIDGYMITYGVQPQVVREPSGFELFVKKCRGAKAYICGKIKDGFQKVKNWFQTPIKATKGVFAALNGVSKLNIIGTTLGVGIKLASAAITVAAAAKRIRLLN